MCPEQGGRLSGRRSGCGEGSAAVLQRFCGGSVPGGQGCCGPCARSRCGVPIRVRGGSFAVSRRTVSGCGRAKSACCGSIFGVFFVSLTFVQDTSSRHNQAAACFCARLFVSFDFAKDTSARQTASKLAFALAYPYLWLRIRCDADTDRAPIRTACPGAPFKCPICL